jgi:two-component system chemotaxis sensor kinase CheA
VVVVHTGRGQYGIEVDVLLGQQQAAVKPLGRLFKTLRGISGASILDSGELALILDIDPLRDLATLTVDAQAVALSH